MVPFELQKTLGKHQKVRFLSSPLVNPGFPRVFRISGQFLWLSVPIHACPCLQVLPLEKSSSCAALDPTNISVSRASESPESSHKPRFSWENMWFCSGGAGFELGEFES